MRLEGRCLGPRAYDSDIAIVSPTVPPEPGCLVVIWPKTGKPQMKQLVVRPMCFDLDRVASDVMPAVVTAFWRRDPIGCVKPSLELFDCAEKPLWRDAGFFPLRGSSLFLPLSWSC